MSYNFKRFIVHIAFALLLGFCSYGSIKLFNYSTYKFSGESHDVPGVVMGKNIEQYAHGKHHRNMSTRYVMAVRPDNQTKFHNYSIYVDYATYCGYNVGDRIQFNNQPGQNVLRNYKSKTFYEWTIYVILPFMIMILLITFTIVMFIYSFIKYSGY